MRTLARNRVVWRILRENWFGGLDCGARKEPKKKPSKYFDAQFSRIEGKKPLEGSRLKFACSIQDVIVITYATFGDDRSRGLVVARVRISGFPIDFRHRPYNTRTSVRVWYRPWLWAYPLLRIFWTQNVEGHDKSVIKCQNLFWPISTDNVVLRFCRHIALVKLSCKQNTRMFVGVYKYCREEHCSGQCYTVSQAGFLLSSEPLYSRWQQHIRNGAV